MDPLTVGGIALLAGYALKKRDSTLPEKQGDSGPQTGGSKVPPEKAKPSSAGEIVGKVGLAGAGAAIAAIAGNELAKFLYTDKVQQTVFTVGIALAVGLGILFSSYVVAFAVVFIALLVLWIVALVQLTQQEPEQPEAVYRQRATDRYIQERNKAYQTMLKSMLDNGLSEKQAMRVATPIADGFASQLNSNRWWAVVQKYRNEYGQNPDTTLVGNKTVMEYWAAHGQFVSHPSIAASTKSLTSGIEWECKSEKFRQAIGMPVEPATPRPGAIRPGSAWDVYLKALAPFAGVDAESDSYVFAGKTMANIAAYRAWYQSERGLLVSDYEHIKWGKDRGAFMGEIDSAGNLLSQAPKKDAQGNVLTDSHGSALWVDAVISPVGS